MISYDTSLVKFWVWIVDVTFPKLQTSQPAVSFHTVRLANTGTASANSGAVIAYADPAADPDPIDKQRSRSAAGGETAVDERVAVNEIRTVDSRVGDLDYGKCIVGLPWFINR